MSRYWSKLRCLKGGGSLWTQISGGKGRPPPTIFGIRKLESLGYRMVKKLPKFSTSWVGCTNVTDDRQTDGTAIAYSERERKFTSAKNLVKIGTVYRSWILVAQIRKCVAELHALLQTLSSWLLPITNLHPQTDSSSLFRSGHCWCIWLAPQPPAAYLRFRCCSLDIQSWLMCPGHRSSCCVIVSDCC